jgi:riboflavin kinase / FMN adenylyltransferase
MRLIRGLRHLPTLPDGCVLTIGNFDGVHLGHQRVIRRLSEQGSRLGLPVVVVTFEPLPLEFFMADQAPSRLTRLREKILQFRRLPIDYLVVLPFNRNLAGYEAEQFIRELLVERLRVKHLVVGDDFHFGKNRRGNFTLLQQRGVVDGFSVENSPSFLVDEQRVSSTIIRDALGAGDLISAQRFLGRDYSICGCVVRGDQLGRRLGFPTANVHLLRRNAPLRGVFAVRMLLNDGAQVLHGVANLGMRPTVDGKGRVLLETHVFDFDADLYGQHVEVVFQAKIRDEMRFDSLDQLQARIRLDCERARVALSIDN